MSKEMNLEFPTEVVYTCFFSWVELSLREILSLFLGCYPFTDRDPFFVESCPHVYFAGNQDKFETSILKGNFLLL